MKGMELLLDGRTVDLESPPRLADGELLVPVRGFSRAVGAEVEELDGGRLTVCQGELCLPLAGAELVEIEGTAYAPLKELAQVLGLDWRVTGETVRVKRAGDERTGLEVGRMAPGFTLPDLHTGAPVSADDFRGKKAIFYMWASW